jgi:hypothetical protein
LSDGVDGWNAFAGSNLFVPMLAGFSALAAWAFCRRLLRVLDPTEPEDAEDDAAEAAAATSEPEDDRDDDDVEPAPAPSSPH